MVLPCWVVRRCRVNPCSKYEDMKFSPDADGVYEFYLNMAGETPTVYVKKP